MKIYLVHPISGLTADEVFKYYQETEALLKSWGYDVLTPMYGKGLLRTELMFKDKDYTLPCTTNHALQVFTAVYKWWVLMERSFANTTRHGHRTGWQASTSSPFMRSSSESGLCVKGAFVLTPHCQCLKIGTFGTNSHKTTTCFIALACQRFTGKVWGSPV